MPVNPLFWYPEPSSHFSIPILAGGFMQDVELESLLQEAGYQFDPISGRYMTADAAEQDVDYASEDVADQLEIPIEDLLRWEGEQVQS
jgi:hypothetical protein